MLFSPYLGYDLCEINIFWNISQSAWMGKKSGKLVEGMRIWRSVGTFE
jgi:hypothetical protein